MLVEVYKNLLAANQSPAASNKRKDHTLRYFTKLKGVLFTARSVSSKGIKSISLWACMVNPKSTCIQEDRMQDHVCQKVQF